MGGRAAYTLATALFIGAAGMLGLFAHLSAWIPRPAIYPILIFIGLEISAQSFLATKKEHYPAVALAVIPALAALVMVFADGLLAQAGAMQGKGPLSIDDLAPPLRHQLQTARILSGGFILTSLLWASLLAALIDKRLIAAAVVCLVAAGCSVCGIIHSPLPNGGMIFPWQTDILPKAAAGQGPLHFACAYGLCALLLWGWHIYRVKTNNIDAPLAHH
jgi:AGZA family xanthine/uracil permease-like MFS transporter